MLLAWTAKERVSEDSPEEWPRRTLFLPWACLLTTHADLTTRLFLSRKVQRVVKGVTI